MTTNQPGTTRPRFHSGQTVIVLYDGRYDGMVGRFLAQRTDPNWADIEQRDGQVRSHPMLWLRHPSARPTPGFPITPPSPASANLCP